jgi:TRAP-type C4-dicarboxylate transport system permease small subunit
VFLRILTPINAWIARLCMFAAVAGLLAIVVVVTWQVFGRYVLNDTPTWAEALALVLVLYVTMLGAAVGVRDAGHIGLDSVLALALPERHRIWFEYVIHVLVGIFGALMAWHGGVLAASVMPYKIPILGLPEGINHVPLVIAGVLIVLFSIEHVLALIAGKKVVPSWH